MNKKRSTILLVLISVIIFPLLTGCFGKGEDDPFISLRTRKARMTGEWEINAYTKDVIQTIDTIERTKIVTTVEGDSWERVTTYLGTDRDSSLDATVLNFEMSFDENGYFDYLYEYEINVNRIDQATLTDTAITENVKHEMKGTWNFLSRIDDYKNKERLSLVVLNENYRHTIIREISSEADEGDPITEQSNEFEITSYANGELSYIWELDMLKNSEVHMYQEIDNMRVMNDGPYEGMNITEVGYQSQTLLKTGDDAEVDTE
jgi:hypothetical protein